MEFTLQLGNHCALWDKLKFGCKWSHWQWNPKQACKFYCFQLQLTGNESNANSYCHIGLWSVIKHAVSGKHTDGLSHFRCACIAHTKSILLIYRSLKLQLTIQVLITVPWEVDHHLETSAWSNKIAQEEIWKKRDRCQPQFVNRCHREMLGNPHLFPFDSFMKALCSS